MCAVRCGMTVRGQSTGMRLFGAPGSGGEGRPGLEYGKSAALGAKQEGARTMPVSPCPRYHPLLHSPHCPNEYGKNKEIFMWNEHRQN